MYFARHEHQQGFALGEELLEEEIQSRVRFWLSLQAFCQATYLWNISVQADTNCHVEKGLRARGNGDVIVVASPHEGFPERGVLTGFSRAINMVLGAYSISRSYRGV